MKRMISKTIILFVTAVLINNCSKVTEVEEEKNNSYLPMKLHNSWEYDYYYKRWSMMLTAETKTNDSTFGSLKLEITDSLTEGIKNTYFFEESFTGYRIRKLYNLQNVLTKCDTSKVESKNKFLFEYYSNQDSLVVKNVDIKNYDLHVPMPRIKLFNTLTKYNDTLKVQLKDFYGANSGVQLFEKGKGLIYYYNSEQTGKLAWVKQYCKLIKHNLSKW